MLGLFKKQIHESVEIQRQDVLHAYPEIFAKSIINGEDCDQIADGYGPIGSLTNPIPVNGAIGEIKYLGKLRGKTGNSLFFHRLGNTTSSVCKTSIDIYEVVCLDGTQWNTVYFNLHHPRRSNLAPPGYTLMPFIKGLKIDSPIDFGVNFPVEDFPFGLPRAIDIFYGGKGILERKVRECLAKSNFSRP
ncbi:MAG: hypothetical protein FJ110_08100 [Deltaproteobacteria bacterium]|nr:hypothetical protein [Deltaproteobacteria bacterium]